MGIKHSVLITPQKDEGLKPKTVTQFAREKNIGKKQIMAGQPTPPGPRTPPRNKGLIAGLIKGNQWLISP